MKERNDGRNEKGKTRGQKGLYIHFSDGKLVIDGKVIPLQAEQTCTNGNIIIIGKLPTPQISAEMWNVGGWPTKTAIL